MNNEEMMKKIQSMFPEAEVTKQAVEQYKVVYKATHGSVKEKSFESLQKAEFYREMMLVCHLDDYFQVKPYILDIKE